MANTAITDISTERILLNPTDSRVSVVTGTLDADTPPGSWVVYDSDNDQWIGADSDTAAHKLRRVGVVGYKKRVNQSTGALKTITDNWDVSESEDKRTPIIVSGIVVAKCDDPSAAVDAGTDMMVSDTENSIKVLAEATVTGTKTALKQVTAATVAANLANGDTVGIFALGSCMGDIWGGVNA